jgi:ATP-dependent helicase HrpA
LRIPLLALPTLTRAAVDAAVPGLAVPRTEALLRSLPKEARRGLIPIAAAAAAFIEHTAAPSVNAQDLTHWLEESRGIPAPLIRFDLDAVPKHLLVQLVVLEPAGEPAGESAGALGGKPSGESAIEPGGEPTREPTGAPTGNSAKPAGYPPGKPRGDPAARAPAAPVRELAQGSDLGQLRRRCAARARDELERRARAVFARPWRRFELDELGETVAIEVGQGCVPVYPALARGPGGVQPVYEWSRAEAIRTTAQGATYLARLMLERQARDLAKAITADIQLSLAASPYLHGEALTDLLLQLAFRRACFNDLEPPRTRDAFEAAVAAGRERVHAALAEVTASARTWFTAARALRRLLDDPRARAQGELSQESHGHLRRLFSAEAISSLSTDWLRQLTRYLKSEERRWQRLLARGSEPPHIVRELKEWTGRAQHFAAELRAEQRWLPQLDDLWAWIEEYRVSLYAQELGTAGPVSAARLSVRAAAIEAWIKR